MAMKNLHLAKTADTDAHVEAHWHSAITAINTFTGHLGFHYRVQPVVKIILNDDKPYSNHLIFAMESCHLTAMSVTMLQLPSMGPSTSIILIHQLLYELCMTNTSF